MAPESIESVSVQALALMFMLKQFLAVSPTSDIVWLRLAIDVVSSFKAWPLPFSATAEDLLRMLETEARAPGSYLREKVRMGIRPGLPPRTTINSENTKANLRPPSLRSSRAPPPLFAAYAGGP